MTQPEFVFEHVCADSEGWHHKCIDGNQFWWPKEGASYISGTEPKALPDTWQTIGYVDET